MIENQLKVNRLACLGGNAESYGFEYDEAIEIERREIIIMLSEILKKTAIFE